MRKPWRKSKRRIRIAAQLVELEPDNPQHWEWQAAAQIYLAQRAAGCLGRVDEEAEAYRQAGEMYRTHLCRQCRASRSSRRVWPSRSSITAISCTDLGHVSGGGSAN